MTPEQLKAAWEEFTEHNDFILNPNQKHVNLIVEGVLSNEKQYGLKLCPCRLRDGTKEKDLELLCPCNFKTHTTWTTPKNNKPPMCWCGLFVKR